MESNIVLSFAVCFLAWMMIWLGADVKFPSWRGAVILLGGVLLIYGAGL